jgi:hypothetical protein
MSLFNIFGQRADFKESTTHMGQPIINLIQVLKELNSFITWV